MRTYAMGVLYAVPNVANPTPIPVASLKDCAVDFKQSKKKFNGPYRVAVDVADAALEIGIKIKSADFRASAFNMVFPGATSAVGGVQVALYEQATIAATNTVANGATFVEDGGVLDLSTGKWMTRVAAGPIAGQYSGPAPGVGTYTFAAADAGHIALIVYSYTGAAVGLTLSYVNQLQSVSVPYKLRVYTPFSVNGTVKNVGFDFFSVHFEKLTAAFKVEDWAEADLEGFASQDMIGFTQSVFKAYIGE